MSQKIVCDICGRDVDSKMWTYKWMTETEKKLVECDHQRLTSAKLTLKQEYMFEEDMDLCESCYIKLNEKIDELKKEAKEPNEFLEKINSNSEMRCTNCAFKQYKSGKGYICTKFNTRPIRNFSIEVCSHWVEKMKTEI